MTKPTKRLFAKRRQINLGIRPVRSVSSLCAQWVAKDQSFLRADREDSDQTGRMPRLISLRWAHTDIVGFVMSRLKNQGQYCKPIYFPEY